MTKLRGVHKLLVDDMFVLPWNNRQHHVLNLPNISPTVIYHIILTAVAGALFAKRHKIDNVC